MKKLYMHLQKGLENECIVYDDDDDVPQYHET